jgi:multiple sugar transport system permease protein
LTTAAETARTTIPAIRWRGRERNIVPYLFAIPPVLYLAVFMFWPLGRQMWMSLTDARLINPNGGRFIGLRNYERLINDPALYNSVRTTALYVLATVAIGILLGTISALAIDRPFRGRPVARAILLFGWAVPNVAASLIWLWILNEQSGVFNDISSTLGLGRIPWLSSTDFAFISILIATTWHVAPFVMLVLLAALQSVPEEVREAARVDGADELNVFRMVTLPHILPFMQLAALLVAVWSIRRFELIFLLTGGGPLGSTSTLVVRLRQVAFENYELGMAGAYGAVGLSLAILIAAIHYLMDRRRAKWSTR